MIISRLFLLRSKNISDIFVEKIFSINLFPKKVVKHSTDGQAIDDNSIGQTHFACWITKATDTQSEYLILLFNVSTPQ
jgi:hypothetical protein